MGKKYTLEDWKEERIPQPPYPDDGGSKEEWDKVWGPEREDNWPLYWQYNPQGDPRITKEVAEKIKQAQKDALDKTLKRNVNNLMQLFLFMCKDTPRHEIQDVINIEIRTNKEKFLNPGQLQMVKQQRLNYSFITPDIYKEMQKDEDFDFRTEQRETEDGYIVKFPPNKFELFATAQTYRFINRLKELKKNILEDTSNSESPWDKIDGTAKKCIKLFIDDHTFRGDNDKIAKAFLMSFEIRAEEEYGKPHLGNKTETVRKVLNHSSYQYSKDSLSNRQLRDYLGNYWQNYRNPNIN